MSDFLLENEAVLMGLELIVDHLVDLLLQEGSLLFIQRRVLIKRCAKRLLGNLEVVFNHHKRVLQPILQNLHLLLDIYQLFFGLSVGCACLHDVLFQTRLIQRIITIRFFMGSQLIIELQIPINYQNRKKQPKALLFIPATKKMIFMGDWDWLGGPEDDIWPGYFCLGVVVNGIYLYLILIFLVAIMAKGVKAKKGAKKIDKKANPLFEKRPRNFRVGNNVQPKRNLTRFVRWPKYINFQRQKRILLTRIKVPPTIAQFSRTLDKNQANVLFKLLKKYSPQDAKQRKARLVAEAKLRAEKKEVPKPKPYHLKFGLNHITKLIEEKKAKIVVIANNVDPIELVVWLPTLCKKLDIPYCFVKGKSALGKLVHQKNATVVALTEVRKEDEGELNNLAAAFRTHFNDNKDLDKMIGGFKRGAKSEIKFKKNEAEREKEAIKKMKA